MKINEDELLIEQVDRKGYCNRKTCSDQAAFDKLPYSQQDKSMDDRRFGIPRIFKNRDESVIINEFRPFQRNEKKRRKECGRRRNRQHNIEQRPEKLIKIEWEALVIRGDVFAV